MNGCRTLNELEAQVGEKVIEIFQSSSTAPNPTPSPPPSTHPPSYLSKVTASRGS